VEGYYPLLRPARCFCQQFVGGGVPRADLLLSDMRDFLAVEEHWPIPFRRDHFPEQHGAPTSRDPIRFYHKVDELYPFTF
jgi:hypothetical protein